MRTFCLAVILCLAGCTSLPSDKGVERTVLVTFELPDKSPLPHSGSQRSYRSGSSWDADLYTRQRAHKLAREYGLKLKEGWPIKALGLYCVQYALPSTLPESELLRLVGNRSDVHAIQTNTQFSGMGHAVSSTYDDPLFEYQFGEHAHRLVELHAHSMGKFVSVGIIDSTADDKHPDLLGQITHQTSFAKAKTLADLSHGTAMTGVIAAAEDNNQGVVGLAPDADVHVYGACRSTTGTVACDAFNILKAMQAALDDEVDILNLSLAGPFDPLVSALIDEVTKQGIIVIAAINKENPERNFPASHDSVVAASGELGLWFTQPEQMTTRAGGGYQVFRGTSVSAAGMTGIAALLRAQASETYTRSMLAELELGCAAKRPRLFDHDTCL